MPRRSIAFLLAALATLISFAAPAAPARAQGLPSGPYSTCGIFGRTGTWRATVSSSYSGSASGPNNERATLTQSVNAAVLMSNTYNTPTYDPKLRWTGDEAEGSGSHQATHGYDRYKAPRYEASLRGEGPVTLTLAEMVLDTATCTYDIRFTLSIDAIYTSNELSEPQSQYAKVAIVEAYSVPVDPNDTSGVVSGGGIFPIPIDSEPRQNHFDISGIGGAAIEGLYRQQGLSSIGAAAFTWRLEPADRPYVADLEFKQYAYPTKQLVPVGQKGTVDGNHVDIIAKIASPAEGVSLVEVSFIDVDTGEALPDCTTVVPIMNIDEPIEWPCRWDTEGWAWDPAKDGNPAVAHSQRRIRVQIKINGQVVSQREAPIIVRPKPLILVHGLNSNADAAWGAYQRFVREANDHWEAFPVPGLLTGHSVAAQSESDTIRNNAHRMHSYVEAVRAQENAWHVDIVAHSLGGLISRSYIHHYMPGPESTIAGRPVAAHLIMLGTPNRGSVCADVGLTLNLFFLRDNITAQLNLTPLAASFFNRSVNNQKGTAFSVLAGNNHRFVCDPSETGPSDQFVTVASAHHTFSDVGLTKSSHTEMTSSRGDFVDWVLPRLAVARGAATPQGLASAGLAPAADPAPAAVPQLFSPGAVTVPAGGAASLTLTAPRADALALTFVAPAEVGATLIAPSGATVGASPAGDGAWVRSITVAAPEAGPYTLRLTNAGAAPANVMAALSARGAALAAVATAEPADASGKVALRVSLRSGGTALAGAAVTATLAREDGTRETLALVEGAGGVYAAQVPVGAEQVVMAMVRVTSGGVVRLLPVTLSADGTTAPPPEMFRVYLPLLAR
jgi:pimeloyl-ACP methyl ester carboxylesterase